MGVPNGGIPVLDHGCNVKWRELGIIDVTVELVGRLISIFNEDKGCG